MCILCDYISQNNLMLILSEIDSITHAVLDVVSDVSSCFAASDQIFIKVILGTINKNTSIGSLQNTKYSFRLLVSRMADISPTQIRKIFERLLWFYNSPIERIYIYANYQSIIGLKMKLTFSNLIYRIIHLFYSQADEIESTFTLICSDKVATCSNDLIDRLEWMVGNKISMPDNSKVEFLVKNILFLNNENEANLEKYTGKQIQSSYIVLTTAICTVIGLFLGLVIVAIGSMRSNVFPSYSINFGKSTRGDLHPILSSPSRGEEGRDELGCSGKDCG